MGFEYFLFFVIIEIPLFNSCRRVFGGKNLSHRTDRKTLLRDWGVFWLFKKSRSAGFLVADSNSCCWTAGGYFLKFLQLAIIYF